MNRKPIVSRHNSNRVEGIKCCFVDEHMWETWLNSSQVIQYIVTSNLDRSTYFGYKWNGESLTRVGKGKSPLDFRRHMILEG